MLQQHRQPIEGSHSASARVSAGRSGRLPSRPLIISLLLHVGFSHLPADYNTCSNTNLSQAFRYGSNDDIEEVCGCASFRASAVVGDLPDELVFLIDEQWPTVPSQRLSRR